MSSPIDLSKYFRNDRCRYVNEVRALFRATDINDGVIPSSTTVVLFQLPRHAIPIKGFYKILEVGTGEVTIGKDDDEDGIVSTAFSIGTKGDDVTKMSGDFFDKQLDDITKVTLFLKAAQVKPTTAAPGLIMEVHMMYIDPENTKGEYLI